MRNEALRIYVDRLRAHAEKINEQLDPGFIGIDEPGLAFQQPVDVVGEAYLAQNDLVLSLSVTTTAAMPCAVCNGTVAVPIKAQIMHMEPIDQLKRGVFEMGDVIREAILLEVPLIAEHNNGQCPERESIKKYLKKEGDDQENDEEGYHPFSNLHLDDN